MKNFGEVFCITHQPVIAASADRHLTVNKIVHQEQTSSHVHELSTFSERQNELAELAGGEIAEAKLYAAKLLEQQAA